MYRVEERTPADETGATGKQPSHTDNDYCKMFPGGARLRAVARGAGVQARTQTLCRDLDYIHIFRTYVCIALERQSPLLRAYSDFAVANNEYLIFKRRIRLTQ